MTVRATTTGGGYVINFNEPFWDYLYPFLLHAGHLIPFMKITWTFYPKGQPSITLTVVYAPRLDAVSLAGYLDVNTNTAYVNWTHFCIFNTGDQSTKKALFASLTRVDTFDSYTTINPA